MRYAASYVVPCFDAAILMATSSHSLEFWNDRSLEVLGTRTKDNVLLLESITLSSKFMLSKSINSANEARMYFCIVGSDGLNPSSRPRARDRRG